MTEFRHEAPFQRAVLRLCMTDDAFLSKAAEHLLPEHFTTEGLGAVFKVVKQYWEQYGGRVTGMALYQIVAAFPPERASRYLPEVAAVVALGDVAEADYVCAELRDFIRKSIFAVAHREAMLLFNDGKHDDAYDAMARAQERIVGVDFEAEDRQWFFDELPARQVARHYRTVSADNGIMTGITDLDRLTDGGVQPGELWSVFAYAKRCKTTWLINMGFNATRVHRAPTLHIVLEGKGSQISDRYDACFGQELYSHVKRGEISASVYRMMQEDYAELRRLLVIRTLNDWDVSVLHIVAELKKLRADGFRPKVLIVDYMDLLRARDRVDSETQHQLSAARDLKRLVLNEDLSAWSAWQATRPKPGAHTREHILTSAEIADSYAKARIVDAFGSLNATDDEMLRGEMRVFFEGCRDAPINKVYHVTNDLSRMRMVTSSELKKAAEGAAS